MTAVAAKCSSAPCHCPGLLPPAATRGRQERELVSFCSSSSVERAPATLSRSPRRPSSPHLHVAVTKMASLFVAIQLHPSHLGSLPLAGSTSLRFWRSRRAEATARSGPPDLNPPPPLGSPMASAVTGRDATARARSGTSVIFYLHHLCQHSSFEDGPLQSVASSVWALRCDATGWLRRHQLAASPRAPLAVSRCRAQAPLTFFGGECGSFETGFCTKKSIICSDFPLKPL